MKHTNLLFVLFCLMFVARVNSLAVVGTDLLIQKNVNVIEKVNLIATSTPTAVPTISLGKFGVRKPIVVVTITAKATVTPSVTPTVVVPTTAPTSEVTETAKETLVPTKVETTPTTVASNVGETTENSDHDLSKWFLLATIILLVMIVIAQSWPKKNEDNEPKDE
jgi:hypothetical protein